MAQGETITIPARSGKAARVKKGQTVKVINTHGEQVVDAWAFNANDLNEFMSMEHTRTALVSIFPKAGDHLYTNKRAAILTITEDTTPGIHDTLMAACDRYRYSLLGCTEYHDNCTDNLHACMKELGVEAPEVPSPLNLFMNIPVLEGGRLDFCEPVTKPGDYIAMRAEMDCIVAFSACPQDLLPINGKDATPTEAHFAILDQDP